MQKVLPEMARAAEHSRCGIPAVYTHDMTTGDVRLVGYCDGLAVVKVGNAEHAPERRVSLDLLEVDDVSARALHGLYRIYCEPRSIDLGGDPQEMLR